MAEPVLIWGAGAIGGSAGAWLKRAGHDVTFLDVVAEHVAAIRDPLHGLRSAGPVEEFVVTAPAFTPAQMSGRRRQVLLAVKAQDTAAATHALAPFLAEDGFVLSLQNGLNDDIIAGIVGPRGFSGFEVDAFRPGASEAATRANVAAIAEFNRCSAKMHSGVWRDLWVRKRRTEVDVMIAPVVEHGARHGIDCRATRYLGAMVHQAEQGKRPMSEGNLLELARESTAP